MALLRVRFRRRPAASAGVLLACAWIAITVYETVSYWGEGSLGWFFDVSQTVTLCSIGVVAIACVVWLVERAIGGSPR